ncbi:MAG: response regulator receiver protein [Myxococcales bacterium]|nr:response regulator receiver protein [Myxococcales bacterium]
MWVSEPLVRVLRERLSSKRVNAEAAPKVVSTAKDFLEATRDPKTISFLDNKTIEVVGAIAHVSLPGPIIAICNEPLQTAIGWLQPYPWISHVISATMLQHPIVEEHLDNVMRTLTATTQPRLLDWLGDQVAGRRVRLTHSHKRVARLERMGDYFDSKGIGTRTIETLRDAAEELLTNAFYDAPVAAGAMKKPVSRTQDIALPDDSACDLAYGYRDDLAIVRVRDPFGSLSRRRLVEVLTRCARTDMKVEVDETMGGAGLGMWRVFSGASFVGVSVVKNRHTEVLVGVAKKAPGPRPFAFHLFFRDGGGKRKFWKVSDDTTSNKPSINKSIVVVAKSK